MPGRAGNRRPGVRVQRGMSARRSSSFLLLPVLTLGLAAALPRPAAACSCAWNFGHDEPCEGFGWADAVFVGHAAAVVREVRPSSPEGDVWPSRGFVFDVLEAFAGVDGPTVEVETGLGGGDCGWEFVLGESYLVFAGRGEDGILHVSICGPTQLLARATAKLAYARRVAAGQPRTALYGLVEHRRQPSFEVSMETTPLADVRVIATGPGGQRFAAETDGKGCFAIEGRLEGVYTVRAEPKARPPIEVTVEVPAGGCAGAELVVSNFGAVRGRVFDPDGRPHHTEVEAVPVDRKGRIAEYGRDGVTCGDDGSFELDELPAGRYVVAANLYGGAADAHGRSLAVTYYPGVADPAAATRFEIVAGQTLDLGEVELVPDEVEEVEETLAPYPAAPP